MANQNTTPQYLRRLGYPHAFQVLPLSFVIVRRVDRVLFLHDTQAPTLMDHYSNVMLHAAV